jgi:chemotaxis protein CheX
MGMAEQSRVRVHGAEIEHVVENVFATAMGIEVRPTDAQFKAEKDQISAAVYLSGDWDGAMLLHCSPRQARLFTGRFTSSEPPESVNDEVRDVLGEVANMIAGSLKSGLFKGVKVSLPSVVEGSTYSLSVRGKNLMTDRRAFSYLGAPFWVTLIELWE